MQARDSTNFDEELLAILVQTIQRLGGSVPAAPKSSNLSERLLQLLRVLSPLLTGEYTSNRVDSWGEIMGTLSNQLDLWEALSNRATLADLVAIANLLSDKVSLTTIQNIQARHVFSPSTVGPPFSLGANAAAKRVTGLNADLVDGYEAIELLTRSNHTGMQAIATVAGLPAVLDGKQPLSALLTAITSLTSLGLIEYTSEGTIGTRTVALGSNTNGRFFRLGAFQVCWGNVTLVLANAASLARTWTFPAAFATVPAVVFIPADGGANTTPGYTRLSSPHCTSISTTAAGFRIGRSTVDFVSGDTCLTGAIAVGQWQ